VTVDLVRLSGAEVSKEVRSDAGWLEIRFFDFKSRPGNLPETIAGREVVR
jgi:hypothetical protein